MDARNIDARELLSHREFLTRLARSLIGDEHAAEDLVQEACLAALRREEPLRAGLRPWLAGTVRNLARMSFRGRARRRRREYAAARPEAVAADRDVAADLELAGRLVHALLSLDEPLRTVLVLRFYRDEPPRAIAARLGIPVETVRSRARRGVERLRAELGAENGPGRRELAVLLLPLARGAAVKKTAAIVVTVLLLAAGAGTVAFRLLRTDAGRTPTPAARAAGGVPDPQAPPDVAGIVAATAAPGKASEPDGVPPDDVAVVAVRDPEGRPVAGATVTLLAEALVWEDNHPAAVATATTDGRGRVRLPVRPHERYMLKIVRSGYAVAGDIECFGGAVTETRLGPGGVLTGTVTDRETGRPIAGASVYAMDACMLGILHEWHAVTDERGRYRIEGVGPGLLNMQATVPDHAVGLPEFLPRARAGRETRTDFSLPRGVRLTLRVTDGATGRPVPEASVEYGFTSGSRGPGDRLVTPPLPPGEEVPILVSAPGYARRAIRLDVGAVGRPQDPIAVTLDVAVPVAGVLRTPKGEPLAGREVKLASVDGERSLRGVVTTDADGVFAGELGLPGADLHVSVRLASGEIRDLGTFPVAPDLTEMRLDPIVVGGGGRIHGIVVDDAGRPLPRAVIHVRPKDRANGPPLATGFVDPRGRFAIDDLPEGDVTLVLVGVEGRPDSTRELRLSGDVGIEWRLDPGFVVSGRVRDTEGNPQRLDWVVAAPDGAMARTDGEGRFCFRGLSAGPHRIYLRDHPRTAVEGVRGGQRNVEITISADPGPYQAPATRDR